MDVTGILAQLGYADCPNYLRGTELARDVENSHIFRKARENCGLHGAYVLREPEAGRNLPVVYVCEAADEKEAQQIHKRVWNQSVVPFLLVVSPRSLRVYSGFRYEKPRDGLEPGLLQTITKLSDIANFLAALRPRSIDSGRVWGEWGAYVTPEHRVDQKLLTNLFNLDLSLQQLNIPSEVSHAVIGRCVYLKYLRARNILSDRRLEEWKLSWDASFGRTAKLNQFQLLNTKLNEWLNGSIFPLSAEWINSIGEINLRFIAGIFGGDAQNQLHLDFEAYDFSFIPIETLSIIYERFLHTAKLSGTSQSKGEAASAYYTPAPLVRYVVERMNREKPLTKGMHVLDPSCGSGAFLVDCYRKLIETELNNSSRRLRPAELRELLTDHIFGIDVDQDACRVAEFSLLLTLLDYIEPPDLLAFPNFRLPDLSGKNIIHNDAFDNSLWANRNGIGSRSYDWVIGNPPWKELRPKELTAFDKAVHRWMVEHRQDAPTGGNQVAEAFAWRALSVLSDSGIAGLVMPASSLFKYEANTFRRGFFSSATLISVANFSNLAEVLFAGRSRVPASVMLFSRRSQQPELVEVYSPLLANQVSQAPSRKRERRDIWSITVNTSEIRDIKYKDIVGGGAMPWKLAAWGSHLDARLLDAVRRKNQQIGDLEKSGAIEVSQGLELRQWTLQEALEPHPELEGMPILELAPLARLRRVLSFPEGSLRRVDAAETYVRKGRFKIPYSVCRPPHLIVGASRTFAIYSERTVIVPARQIGVRSKNRELLKALSLLIISDFAIYQQVMTSPQYLTKRPVATLKAFRELPVPFDSDSDLSLWVSLHDQIVSSEESERPKLMQKLNSIVNEAFGLDSVRASVVEDFVNVRMSLLDGQMGEAAVGRPTTSDLASYAQTLSETLDNFIDSDRQAGHHSVQIFQGDDFALTRISYSAKPNHASANVSSLPKDQSRQLSLIQSRLVEKFSQWLYFNRNFKFYEGSDTYILKPLQRFHWVRSQAALDAGDVIAERVEPATA